MLAQHFDPAWGVASHTQRLIVDSLVLVVAATGQHGVDGAQHLVRQGDDGLLVSLSDGQRVELGLQRAARSGRRLRELAQQPTYPGIAPADAPPSSTPTAVSP